MNANCGIAVINTVKRKKGARTTAIVIATFRSLSKKVLGCFACDGVSSQSYCSLTFQI